MDNLRNKLRQRKHQKHVVVADAVKFAIFTATFTIATVIMLSFFK